MQFLKATIRIHGFYEGALLRDLTKVFLVCYKFGFLVHPSVGDRYFNRAEDGDLGQMQLTRRLSLYYLLRCSEDNCIRFWWTLAFLACGPTLCDKLI